MIPVSANTQIWLAAGKTDMRKDFDGLAMLTQSVLERDPFSGHLVAFRGRVDRRLGYICNVILKR